MSQGYSSLVQYLLGTHKPPSSIPCTTDKQKLHQRVDWQQSLRSGRLNISGPVPATRLLQTKSLPVMGPFPCISTDRCSHMIRMHAKRCVCVTWVWPAACGGHGTLSRGGILWTDELSTRMHFSKLFLRWEQVQLEVLKPSLEKCEVGFLARGLGFAQVGNEINSCHPICKDKMIHTYDKTQA